MLIKGGIGELPGFKILTNLGSITKDILPQKIVQAIPLSVQAINFLIFYNI